MNLINLELLVKLRKDSKLTQTELAKIVGVKRAMINNIEAGRVNPGLGVAIKLANVLNCKIDDLVFFGQSVYFEGNVGDKNVKHPCG